MPATTSDKTFARLLELAARLHVDDDPHSKRTATAQYTDGQWVVTVRGDNGDLTYILEEHRERIWLRSTDLDLCAECGERVGESADEGCASCIAHAEDSIDYGAMTGEAA